MYVLCECSQFNYLSNCTHSRDVRRAIESGATAITELEFIYKDGRRSWNIQVIP